MTSLQAHQAIPSMAEPPILLRYVREASDHLTVVVDLVAGVAQVCLRMLTFIFLFKVLAVRSTQLQAPR